MKNCTLYVFISVRVRSCREFSAAILPGGKKKREFGKNESNQEGDDEIDGESEKERGGHILWLSATQDERDEEMWDEDARKLLPKHLASIGLIVAPHERNSFLFLSYLDSWEPRIGSQSIDKGLVDTHNYTYVIE